MKIILDDTMKKATTISKFFEDNNIALKISRRLNKEWIGTGGEYYVDACDVKIKDELVLLSCMGEGSTPLKAIEELTSNISGKLLVKSAHSEHEEEIKCPRLEFSRACQDMVKNVIMNAIMTEGGDG